ncbi:MAG: ABC transporter ATP-binding protein [Anaerolineae bacterium]|nr:ABC transporter ATP-binding protein [Anaerolineae bacterium]
MALAQPRDRGPEVSSDEAVVRTVDLVRTYHLGSEPVYALRGVNLSVPRGQFVALKGRSGSGKTTLLNLISGLDSPTSGQVYLLGHDLAKASEAELLELRRRHIGFVFQSFALIPTFSAFENVDLMLRIGGFDRRERSRRVRECLDLVGLLRWAGHRPYELSGGQQQRVAIARALANRPELLIADEPTGELDSVTGRQILELFREIVDSEGVTLVMATHDPTVEDYADIIYELVDGQILEAKDMRTYLSALGSQPGTTQSRR